MKFFKPKFVNKLPVQGQKPPPAQSTFDEPTEDQLTTVLHSPKPPAKSPMSPPQQQQPTATPVKTSAGIDSVDSVAPATEPIQKEGEAVCALVTLRMGCATEQQQQQQIPKIVVDLDDSASAVGLSDGEYADDEGEDEAAGVRGAAVVTPKFSAVDAGARHAGMTLFQRKRPVYHQNHQQQQQMQNQQQSPQSLLGKRSTTCCGSLRSMRMRDLIYWCPKDQPPPKWRRESASGMESVASTESVPDSQKPAEQPQGSLQTDSVTRLAPQVMLDSSGNIVLNEESLYIRESAPIIVEEVREDCTELRATYRSFRSSGTRGSATRGRQWSYKETLLFYKAVSTIGTDFSYMASLFNSRSREELKRKYKREEKANPHLIDQMLKKRKPYDLSMFEPGSDSDIEISGKKSSSVNGMKNGKLSSGSGGASKPSDIVMEGLKQYLQDNQLRSSKAKQQQQQQIGQQEQTVTVVIQ